MYENRVLDSRKLILMSYHSLIPYLIGVFIYIMCRGFSLGGLQLKSIKSYSGCLCSNNFITYSLPDGLWLYSFATTIVIIWNGSINKKNIVWISFLAGIALIGELGQFVGIIKGTFDIYDLLAYLLAIIMLLFLNFKLKWYGKN